MKNAADGNGQIDNSALPQNVPTVVPHKKRKAPEGSLIPCFHVGYSTRLLEAARLNLGLFRPFAQKCLVTVIIAFARRACLTLRGCCRPWAILPKEPM
jgi:hypothetical protein